MGPVLNDRHEDAAPYILGATLAALALPALVLGLSAPLWLGLGAAVAILAGAVALAQTARLRTRAPALPGGLSPARAALVEAATALSRLDAAAPAIHASAPRAYAQQIAQAAHTIVGAVEADPAVLAEMQRVLTYYLPRAATIVESYGVLEARGGDDARLARIEALLAKLDSAFHHYADRLPEQALHLLDVEIRLVDAALRDDLGETS